MILQRTLAIIILAFAPSLTFGAIEYPPLSAKGWVKQTVGNTNIEIEYERPSARDRTIFGKLVPWGELWRTGAGHSTKISFDKDVEISGQSIPKGRYSIFTIPNVDQWTVILNSDTSLYGKFNYDSNKDIARFTVAPMKTVRFYETMTIDIDLIPNNARIYISWENTQVAFDVLTSTDAEMIEYINSYLLERKSKDSDHYAGAAEYLYYQNTEHQKATALADIAIELDESNGWARRLKMNLYERQGMYSKALEVIAEAILELAGRDQDQVTKERSLQEWKAHEARITNAFTKINE